MIVQRNPFFLQRRRLVLVEPRDQNTTLPCIAHGTANARNLARRLPFAIDDFGNPLTNAALRVHLRIAQLFERSNLQIGHCSIDVRLSRRDLLQKRPEFALFHTLTFPCAACALSPLRLLPQDRLCRHQPGASEPDNLP